MAVKHEAVEKIEGGDELCKHRFFLIRQRVNKMYIIKAVLDTLLASKL